MKTQTPPTTNYKHCTLAPLDTPFLYQLGSSINHFIMTLKNSKKEAIKISHFHETLLEIMQNSMDMEQIIQALGI